MNVLPCTEETLDAAADVLNRGGVAVIPTDTVYGLAAHPAHPDAVERLYSIKGRDARKPIALLAADADAVSAFGATMPPPPPRWRRSAGPARSRSSCLAGMALKAFGCRTTRGREGFSRSAAARCA